jgi:hypothetical protein
VIASDGIWYSRGVVSLQRTVVVLEPPGVTSETGWNHERTRPSQDLYLSATWNGKANPRFAGFQVGSDYSFSMNVLTHSVYFIFPLWVFLPAGIPPFVWWRKWRRAGGRGFAVVPAESTSPK